jgi:hypothetical protein
MISASGKYSKQIVAEWGKWIDFEMKMRSLSKLYGNAGKRLWNEDPEPTFDPLPGPEREQDESEVMYVQGRIDRRRMSDRLWYRRKSTRTTRIS